MIEHLLFISFVLFLSFCMFSVVVHGKSFLVCLVLLLWEVILAGCFDVSIIGWILSAVTIAIYLLFYVDGYAHFREWIIGEMLLLLLCLVLYAINLDSIIVIVYGTILYMWMLYLQKRLSYLIFGSMTIFMILFSYISMQMSSLRYMLTFCILLLEIMLEYQHRRFSKSFLHDTTQFQNEVMAHHYEEVKLVYLNMRGWRHDYHNHIQTLKAYLSLHQLDHMKSYLNELESDLQEVDQLIKSGNLMVDAILNSKLSLANTKAIRLNCKAHVPETLCISDVDICVMIGNLMDNAIEACEELMDDQRFIRVYMDVVHSQLYLSIMNSAKEDLNFNESHYISEKRGDHGHGMKRVQLTVDKYEGYLNLKHEPGVFVSEVMIPLK